MVISGAGGVQPTHTTVHLLAAAREAGWAVRVVEPTDFDIDERGRVQLRAFVLDELPPDRDLIVARLRARDLERRQLEASTLDVLVLRVNPLDTAVVAMAQLVAAAGVAVVNDPAALVRTTHKSWLASLPPEVPRPLGIVTRSRAAAERFASGVPGGLVLKPARSSGGRGVHLLRGRAARRGLEGAFAAAAEAGDGYVVVQAYLPEAAMGEKRLLWLDGELVGGYLRRRAPGEFRHNLKHGAEPAPCDVTRAEREAVGALTPHLLHERIWLAGIDVIGARIVEVNVLNPGGAHFTSAFSGREVGPRLVESLARRARAATPIEVPAK